ncbi:hypothetical protein [Pandoraea norimbergensis]|uniref:Uncharacterized protein n=1 Tax=Pandoraea norimbergensis TaxID=93219 RepID=A0ABN4JQU9_9BURK|nr:hypothetical protein [Pandoraea norimbergensis]ALS62293.1 hypothetical protein AT302_23385 [Pandoraea norimbergensis]
MTPASQAEKSALANGAGSPTAISIINHRSKAMNRNQYEVARRARVEREVRASSGPEDSEADIQEMIEDAIEEELRAEAHDREEDLAMFGSPEDTPCIQSADIWGTGEGQYHGFIG